VTIPVSGLSSTKGCCSGGTPASRGSSGEYKLRSEGVSNACGPASRESVGEDKTDLGLSHLRRRCKKITTPITAKIAATPHMIPPTIAPMSRFLPDGRLRVRSPLAFIVSTGALREVSLVRNEKKNFWRVCFARTSELMVQTQHLARD
jgi:hypothetical protein